MRAAGVGHRRGTATEPGSGPPGAANRTSTVPPFATRTRRPRTVQRGWAVGAGAATMPGTRGVTDAAMQLRLRTNVLPPGVTLSGKRFPRMLFVRSGRRQGLSRYRS